MFAETGETESLDRENVTNKFLDVFTAPPLETGAGVTETKIFLDGKNSKVGNQYFYVRLKMGSVKYTM